ncbi:hypothetical protein AAC387_Pa04g2649 [Persea americana]
MAMNIEKVEGGVVPRTEYNNKAPPSSEEKAQKKRSINWLLLLSSSLSPSSTFESVLEGRTPTSWPSQSCCRALQSVSSSAWTTSSTRMVSPSSPSPPLHFSSRLSWRLLPSSL